MSLRYHEIAEGTHRILNPFSEEKLMLVAEICRLHPGINQLDLACGKGEMLCQWAYRYGINGVGVDISRVFLSAAQERAKELDVANKVSFVEGDAGTYPHDHRSFDVVSCIGATWIGGGLVGTLKLMKPALKDNNGLLLVGEPYWIEMPPPEVYPAAGVGEAEFASLEGTLDRIEATGCELVEMVLANQDTWDRYEAAQWMTVHDWLQQNPNDPDAAGLRDWIVHERRVYLKYTRRYLGWGVFILRPKA